MAAPKFVALMPMKAESERVPGKNFRLLCGRPLYAWTLSALLACKRIDRVVINTDSTTLADEIATHFPDDTQRIQVRALALTARRIDCVDLHLPLVDEALARVKQVLDRPQHLRGHTVPMTSILSHDVVTVASADDIFLQTHSTNPFLTTETLDAAITAFLDGQPAHDSLFSVCALRTRLYDALGRAINHNPAVLLRTQDLPPVLEENSCIYIFRGADLARRHQRVGERPLLFEMDAQESLDIDEEHDWTLTTALFPSVLAARAAAAMRTGVAPLPHAAMPAPSAAAPAEEACTVAGAVVPPARYRCELVTAQPLRPPRGVSPPEARFDVLVSAPYILPHLARFTPILESFGLRVMVPLGLTERLSEEQLLARAGTFDATICGDDAYTARALAACAPRLKVISKWGTGIDSIDRAAAKGAGVMVCNTPEAFTNPVADSSVAYVLAFARGLVPMDASLKAGGWMKMPGVCLAERVVGIIGLGSVGRAVAHRVTAFGASVVAVDVVAPPQAFLAEHPGVRMASLTDVLQAADFLVLCCDLNPGSRHIIDAQALALMQPGAFLINCARGPLVDEPALIKALQSGSLAGAGLDVFEHEPLRLDSPLRSMKNVMLAPHNANASPTAHERVHWNTLKNLLTALNVPFELDRVIAT